MWRGDLIKTVEMQQRELEQKRTIRRIRIIAIVALSVMFGIAFGTLQARAEIKPATETVADNSNPAARFRYSEEIPLSPAIQEYIWNKCVEATDDYENYYLFMLGAIELESSFNEDAVGHNKNGSTDRGLCQINSSRISEMKNLGLIDCTGDLFNIYKNIDCGFELMNRYVEKFGVTESAYYAYNTGREKEGSNKNSRRVMKNMSKWKEVLE